MFVPPQPPVEEPDRLFGNSRFVFRWTAPFFVLGALVFTLGHEFEDLRSVLVGVLVPVLCALAMLGFYDTRRFRWAMRTVTDCVFLLCLAYLLDEVFVQGSTFEPTRRSETSP